MIPDSSPSFDEEGFSLKGMWGNQIINGITQQVTDKIVQKENIRVIERNRIAEVMQEQDFGQTGRVDPATAAEIGRILVWII